jgi:hypothetical protein
MCTGFKWLKTRNDKAQIASLCEHANETSGSVNDEEFLGQPNDHHIIIQNMFHGCITSIFITYPVIDTIASTLTAS